MFISSCCDLKNLYHLKVKSCIVYWWLLIFVAAYCLHSAHVNVSDFTLVFGSLPRGYSVSQDANMRGQPGTFLFQFCTGYFILVSKGINRQIISNAMDICDRQRKLSRFFWYALAQPPIQVGFTHYWGGKSELVPGIVGVKDVKEEIRVFKGRIPPSHSHPTPRGAK